MLFRSPVISLLGIESSVISNNAMHGTITNGINVTQMVGCSFTGNMIEASNAGIVFDSGLTGRNILSANKTSSAATYEVQVVDQQSTDQLNLATDQIPTISIVNNQPNIRYADKFAYFSTASPQSVDYVYGAYKGQVLTIEFADANCTMKDGTGNMKLASDFAASADDTLTMVFNGTNWYEIARSVN